jgi:branched-chain amino acid transport system ATP-binding protein
MLKQAINPASTTAQTVLSIKNLESYYGPIMAIRGVSLEVREGQIVTVLGANGAGKTTLLKTISGVMNPEKGEIWYGGRNIAGEEPDRVVKAGIVHVPEGREVFPLLTVEENLKMGAYVRRDPKGVADDQEMVYGYFPILAERRRQAAGTLSGGQQQMVALARALLNENRILLVDEPTKGLAPLLVTEVARVLERVGENETVLLVEQNLGVVQRLARDVVVLDQGQVVHAGPADELLGNAALLRQLLGVSRAEAA